MDQRDSRGKQRVLSGAKFLLCSFCTQFPRFLDQRRVRVREGVACRLQEGVLLDCLFPPFLKRKQEGVGEAHLGELITEQHIFSNKIGCVTSSIV
jgi:hypothetical protein